MRLRLRRKKAANSPRQRAQAQSSQTDFSYRSRRSDQEGNTGRQVQRGSRKIGNDFWRFWLQRFGLIILLTALLVSAVSMLTVAPSVRINVLSGGDSNLLLSNQAIYQARASQILATSIWNRNKITVDTTNLARQLTTEFPELTNVSVVLPWVGHRPIVYLQPAQPALILISSNGSYVLDTTGKALLVSDKLPPDTRPSLPEVHDQSGLEITLDKQALSSQDVNFIQTIVAQLAARKVVVSSLTLPAAASEVDARISGQPYFVKFNLQAADARQQAGTFLATIAQLQRQGITPGQYIDVRVHGRAYYQ